MNFSGMIRESLLVLHHYILEALTADDRVPEGDLKPYGVRDHPNWKRDADIIEGELISRGLDYVPIPW